MAWVIWSATLPGLIFDRLNRAASGQLTFQEKSRRSRSNIVTIQQSGEPAAPGFVGIFTKVATVASFVI
jgi:hypothetical protein